MRVYGLDFSSNPSAAKPITKADCVFIDATLRVVSLDPLPSWQEFALFLGERGSWFAGMDFPFGQPARLINDLAWPQDWSQYVRRVSALSKQEYAALIDGYRNGQPEGEKEHFRVIDRRAGSLSPMKMYFVPTGKMFHQGAPFLLASYCNIVPFRIDEDVTRAIVEAYPGLVARKFIGRDSYKHDTPQRQTVEHRAARSDIVRTITSADPAQSMVENYGFSAALTDTQKQQCIDDPTGDVVDSVLCAIQAGWAYTQRQDNFGVPDNCDLREGWIPDPETSEQEEGQK